MTVSSLRLAVLELKEIYAPICRQRKAKDKITSYGEINNAARLTQKRTFLLVIRHRMPLQSTSFKTRLEV